MGVLVFLLWLASVVVGTVMGIRRGRLWMGLIASVVLGWVGVVLMLFVGRSPQGERG